ncbi:poly-gamma-glutamate system protein [bacterium]|nr:poly-gamma-glutamate system protein [bacterium]
MQAKSHIPTLIIVLAVALIAVFVVNKWFVSEQPLAEATNMHEAADICAHWCDLVAELKEQRGIVTDSRTATRYAAMIGDDFSVTTTTLGSLESKETAANPDFAALMVRWFGEAGLDSTSTIGVSLSGSFPSLGLATLAAAKTLGMQVVMCSSLGSSSFGANQPEMTWIDIETGLRSAGELPYRSALVTLGAENDGGDGMQEEGVAAFHEAARRCGVELYEPVSLDAAIARKTSLMRDAGIDLYVNIGGNQSSLGRCAHSSTIPTGLHDRWRGCSDNERGVLVRLAENGVPFIHLLNIKDIAGRYGLPISPGQRITPAKALYHQHTVNRIGPIVAITLMFGLLAHGRSWRSRPRRAESARVRNKNASQVHFTEQNHDR